MRGHPPTPLLCIASLALMGSTACGQLIQVLGNGRVIAPGDTTPSLEDHTDFGAVDFAAGVVDRTFTIRNTGSQTLIISGMGILPVQAFQGEFTMPVPPAQVLGHDEQTTFTIRFNPATVDTRSALVRIQSNASNALLFEFVIRGRGTSPAPRITILGNGLEILNGDPFPRTADHTDFGTANTSGGSVARTFTIRNEGDRDLIVNAVELIGGQFNEFSVTAPPAQTVFAGSQTTFTVKFDPSDSGVRRTTVRVHNTDAHESPYDFAIQGTGTSIAPELTLLGDGLPIPAGDNTPSLDDGTKFPGTIMHSGLTHTFTIVNAGSSGLAVGSIVTVGGHASDFAPSAPPPDPIPPGGTATIEVRFRPSVSGPRATTLRLVSNDPVAPVYEVALLGVGGTFALTAVERAGPDVLLRYTTNPDTTADGFLYTIKTSVNLRTWTTIHAFASPGGTTEQFRVIGGATDRRRYWRLEETAL